MSQGMPRKPFIVTAASAAILAGAVAILWYRKIESVPEPGIAPTAVLVQSVAPVAKAPASGSVQPPASAGGSGSLLASVVSSPVQSSMGWESRPLADPETERRAARARDAQNTDALYGRFYRAADLTAEEQEKFRALRGDQKEEVSRLLKAASQQNAASDRDLAGTTLEVVKEEVAAAFEPQFKQALGPEKFEQLKRYDSERALRSMSGQVASALAKSPEPLSEAQTERLVGTLAVSAMSAQGVLDFAQVDVQRTLRAAGEFLTPAQVEALQPLLQARVRAAEERRRPSSPPTSK